MQTASETIKFIERVFGKARVYAKNVDVHCPTPACQNSTKKRLSIRLDDHVCHCWVCGFGGRTLLPLLVKYGSTDDIAIYKEKFLPDIIDLTKYNVSTSLEESAKSVVKLPSDFKLLATSGRARDPDIKSCKKYVESRGITERELWCWKMGTSNEPGLRRRIIIPSFSQEGTLNYYVARAIDKVPFMKYTNSDGDSKNIVFNELNIDWTRRLTIVEGPFDLVKCRGNATCLLGSNLSEHSALFNQIYEHQTPVTLMLDNDQRTKTQKIGKMLSGYGIDVRIVNLEKKDPGEMTFSEVDEAIANAQPWSWSDMFAFKLKAAMSCSLKVSS